MTSDNNDTGDLMDLMDPMGMQGTGSEPGASLRSAPLNLSGPLDLTLLTYADLREIELALAKELHRRRMRDARAARDEFRVMYAPGTVRAKAIERYRAMLSRTRTDEPYRTEPTIEAFIRFETRAALQNLGLTEPVIKRLLDEP